MSEPQDQTSADKAAQDEHAVTQQKQIEGLRYVIDEKRNIVVYPSKISGRFDFAFYNDGLKTHLTLSREAVQAIHFLWFELERKGLAA